jgi:hypothetical protein
MYSNTQTKLVVQERPAELKPTASPRVQELMTLGRQESWEFAVLGQAPMPTQPVRLRDWLIVPAEQDSSEIPERALARVQFIFAAGIRPKGFILVHEAPMELPAPKEEQGQTLKPQWALDPETTQKTIETLSFGVTTLAKVMAGAVTVAAAVGAVLLPAIFLTGVALIDPILIAVTEDDYWIEIDRWWA